MKPLIGITSNIGENRIFLNNDNSTAISFSNGVPVILPNVQNEDEIEKIAETIDGLLVSGGGDIDPTLFDEEPHKNLGLITPERDVFEVSLIQRLLDLNKPILAICRGSQILNIAAGGDMYQDIYSQTDTELLQHHQNAPRTYGSHYIKLDENSILFHAVHQNYFRVNSFHHQAVRNMAPNFKVSATSKDGIIEAIESKVHKFVLGVQWHPENMVVINDSPSISIFKDFINSCK